MWSQSFGKTKWGWYRWWNRWWYRCWSRSNFINANIISTMIGFQIHLWRTYNGSSIEFPLCLCIFSKNWQGCILLFLKTFIIISRLRCIFQGPLNHFQTSFFIRIKYNTNLSMRSFLDFLQLIHGKSLWLEVLDFDILSYSAIWSGDQEETCTFTVIKTWWKHWPFNIKKSFPERPTNED